MNVQMLHSFCSQPLYQRYTLQVPCVFFPSDSLARPLGRSLAFLMKRAFRHGKLPQRFPKLSLSFIHRCRYTPTYDRMFIVKVGSLSFPRPACEREPELWGWESNLFPRQQRVVAVYEAEDDLPRVVVLTRMEYEHGVVCTQKAVAWWKLSRFLFSNRRSITLWY